MNLTKQDMFVILGCFGLEAAQDDISVDAAVINSIGHLVTATDAQRLEMMQEMHAAVVAALGKLPTVIQKLAAEIDALQPPAPELPAETEYYQSFSND